MVVLHDGMVWAGYDKHFLPNYGVFDEFRIFAAGDRTVVLDIDGVRIGVAICEDIWQDGGPVARLAVRGGQDPYALRPRGQACGRGRRPDDLREPGRRSG
jgi:predicted amidohydrolase